VEFGILAILFALMLFAIVDFGLLLNGWVSISSTTRDAARWASTGVAPQDVYTRVQTATSAPGVAAATLNLHVDYDWVAAGLPQHQQVDCNPSTCPSGFGGPPPPPGVAVKATVWTDTYEVITPLVRPFFKCPSTLSHCYIKIQSFSTMRFEGP
jgi:hypothetical protein